MQGQGAIIGVGALEYPAEWQGASQETLNRNAVSKILTLTSTYDHRIIQGAQSGDFLRIVHQLLLGENGFYDEIFECLRIPYEPIRWVQDISAHHDDDVNKTARVQELIHAYRVRGHLMADTDPLEYRQRRHPDLDVTTHGLTLWDLERDFATGGFGGAPMLKLRKILGILRDSYCRTIGIEYMHIQDPEQRRWIQDKVEVGYAKPGPDEQLRILRRLNAAEAFETFLQTKFVGQKRFSLEGGESVIALLDRILCRAAADDMDEVCIGMPHRGRLNVLANIAGKSYGQIFREFEGKQDPKSVQGSGDVKYHLGTEGEFVAEDGSKTKVYLAANPSPPRGGQPRPRGHRPGQAGPARPRGRGLHRAAAAACTATRPSPARASWPRRSTSRSCAATAPAARSTSSSTTRSASPPRRRPRRSIILDRRRPDDPGADLPRERRRPRGLRAGRRAGLRVPPGVQQGRRHRHGLLPPPRPQRGRRPVDDPAADVQPHRGQALGPQALHRVADRPRRHQPVEDAEAALRDYQQQLERVFVETKAALKEAAAGGQRPDPGRHRRRGPLRPRAADGAGPRDQTTRSATDTAISPEVLQHIGDAFVEPAAGLHRPPQAACRRWRSARQSTREGGIDWAMGELLAFGSLLMEGTPVRLAGQDSRRGTFVQRHAVLIDKNTAEEWTPLLYLGEGQARFWVYDSLLSEFAAMGFEYGYSVERPDALVLWEAQFGDFVNGAQTIVDEFISSLRAEVGPALLGRAAAAARLRGPGARPLLGAHRAVPADVRRGQHDGRLPVDPGELLPPAAPPGLRPAAPPAHRLHPEVDAAAQGGGQRAGGLHRPARSARSCPTAAPLDAGSVTRVLLASGKVVYDLEAEREKRGDTPTAIVRVEQLATRCRPRRSHAELAKYPDAEVVWVQDEPRNQGAWPFMALNLPQALAERGETRALRVVVAPGVGLAGHRVEQAARRAAGRADGGGVRPLGRRHRDGGRSTIPRLGRSICHPPSCGRGGVTA